MRNISVARLLLTASSFVQNQLFRKIKYPKLLAIGRKLGKKLDIKIFLQIFSNIT